MPVMFLDCPNDGMLPVEAPFVNSTSYTISMTGSAFPCPVCGAHSPMVDMDLHPHDEAVELRPAPEQLAELQAALTWATRAIEDGTVSDREIVGRLSTTIQRTSPELFSRLVKASTGRTAMGIATWAALLVAVITLLTQNQQAGFTIEDLERMSDLIEQHQGDTRSPRYPESPMPVVPLPADPAPPREI